MLESQLAQNLQERYQQLLNAGLLLSREQLAHYYATFRSHFDPERLRSLDGEALLNTMHDHSNRESLVYWLEFKDDEEFPARSFGGIGGGSALKFGIYRRKETGAWMTGSPTKQVELTTDDAVQVARRHREQLLRGVDLLTALPPHADEAAYQQLQLALEREVPDVSGTAWGHKYFSLLFPDKLDDYHVENLQRFHLLKLLQLPPEGQGRYLCAGRYVAIAAELDLPLNHVTTLLNTRNGRLHRYWRILVNYQEKGWQKRWEPMLQDGYVALGWGKLGDLAAIARNQEDKNRLTALMRAEYGEKGGWAQEVFNFVAIIEPGDLVLAFEKNTVLGIGRITGSYNYVSTDAQSPHRRAVEWLTAERWDLPEPESSARTVRELRLPANLIAAERCLLRASIPTPHPRPGSLHLTGLPGRIQAILERKGQVILYGPPGTGKTYWARRAALDLAALGAFDQPFAQLSTAQQAEIAGDETHAGLVRTCTFHPAYGYEDFIEGYRPQDTAGQLTFSLQADRKSTRLNSSHRCF